MNTQIKNKYSYSTHMRKLILSQFGAAVLAIMTSMPTMTISEDNSYGDLLGIATTVLAVVFFMYLQYTAVWEIAAKDKIAIDGGRMNEDKLRGLKAALLANIPTYAFVTLSIVFKAIFLITDVKGIGLCSDIFYALELFWNYMYHGFLVMLVPKATSWVSLLYFAAFAAFTIPSLLCCYIAYNQGLKVNRIFPEKKKN